MTTGKIGGVTATAPLFNGCPEETLIFCVKMLSDASFHYAGDTSKEWGEGNRQVALCAKAINAHKLRYAAIECIQRHEPQLVSLAALVDAVLKQAREGAGA